MWGKFLCALGAHKREIYYRGAGRTFYAECARCGHCGQRGLILLDKDGNGVRLTDHKMVPANPVETFLVSIGLDNLEQSNIGGGDG